jgi:hypothetical protein
MGLRLQLRPPENHTKSRRWQNLVAGAVAGDATRRGPDASVLPGALDDEAVLRRAKDLCAQDGAVWEAGDLDQAARWERNKMVVDCGGRQKYLALAREELIASD